LSTYGLPTTLLLILLWYHVKVIQEKDCEIKRINEERVKEKQTSAESLLQVVEDFNRLQSEQAMTLKLLENRLER